MDALAGWVREATGATDVHMERRSGGASRAGYAVDAVLADGTTRALWLRADTGHGPQSHTKYTVRREATVYRALRDTAVGVPRLVAVHPTEEAFLSERLEGRNWFAEITSPQQQLAVATEYMQRLAALHALDPAGLELPGFGPPGALHDHINEELDEWQAQLARHREPEPEPVIVWSLRWLRAHLPPDGHWPVVLVHGDAGPGNFLYDGDHVVAVMDWEMAHYGDLHEDLGWLYVRDAQERFTSLPERLRDYERAAGRRIDRGRLLYFRVLAQARCAIGTANGLAERDHRGEIANHLIYGTMHQRLLVEALAGAMGVDVPECPALDGEGSAHTWMYDVALDDLRDVVVPAVDSGFAARRAKGLARLVKYLREAERLGPARATAEAADLAAVLGDQAGQAGRAARADLCAAIDAGTVTDDAALWWCARAAARATQIAAPAMGALATRHYAPLPHS
jgi:aminoglycoside phosphotransferase (APT) family kinase protein